MLLPLLPGAGGCSGRAAGPALGEGSGCAPLRSEAARQRTPRPPRSCLEVALGTRLPSGLGARRHFLPPAAGGGAWEPTGRGRRPAAGRPGRFPGLQPGAAWWEGGLRPDVAGKAGLRRGLGSDLPFAPSSTVTAGRSPGVRCFWQLHVSGEDPTLRGGCSRRWGLAEPRAPGVGGPRGLQSRAVESAAPPPGLATAAPLRQEGRGLVGPAPDAVPPRAARAYWLRRARVADAL